MRADFRVGLGFQVLKQPLALGSENLLTLIPEINLGRLVFGRRP